MTPRLPPVPTKLPANYWRQWTASAISNLGDGINFVAMPLLAISLTSDERLLSLTTFALFVPWLIISLPVGVLVDRVERRALMIGSNAIRVAIFLTIAGLATAETISIWTLIALLIVIGCCEVVFDSSAQAFLPALVRPEQLAKANGWLFAVEVVAGSIAGLSIGAFLFNFSVGVPFTVNAVSFAVAALLIMSITVPARRSGDRPAASHHDQGGMAVGVSWLRRHRLLRTLALMFAVTNFGLMFSQGIFVKYALVTLGLNNWQYGVLLAVTAVGGASGGLLGSRVIRRVGLRNAVIGPYLVFGVAHAVIGVAPAAWVVALAGFLLGAAITIWNVVTVTVRQQLIPAELFGRVNSVYRFLGAAASAAGVACGGLLAYATTLKLPFIVGGGITLVAATIFARPVLIGLASADEPDGISSTSPTNRHR